MTTNILIAYFTHSGNTEHIAKLIQAETEGILCRIEPEEDYPLAYREIMEQARKEVSQGALPTLKPIPKGISSFNTIFLGTPQLVGFNRPAAPHLPERSQHGRKESDSVLHPWGKRIWPNPAGNRGTVSPGGAATELQGTGSGYCCSEGHSGMAANH